MSDYPEARETLRQAEIDLTLQREQVAEARRQLPPGPPAQQWVFATEAGPATLDDLVGDRPLVLYHFMYGKAQTDPCPSCSMWIDGWNAVAHHLDQNVDLAVVAAAPYDDWAAVAAERGWHRLRLLSAADSSFKVDVGGEDDTGNQMPFLSVWERDGDAVHMTYSGGAHIRDDHWRGIDLLSPVWHMLDLTGPGRGDWMPSLSY